MLARIAADASCSAGQTLNPTAARNSLFVQMPSNKNGPPKKKPTQEDRVKTNTSSSLLFLNEDSNSVFQHI